MVVSRKKLTFRNRNYAVLWWEKRKNSVLQFVLNSFFALHSTYVSPIVLIFVLRLVLRLLCYVRTHITKSRYSLGFTYLNFCFILQENNLITFGASSVTDQSLAAVEGRKPGSYRCCSRAE